MLPVYLIHYRAPDWLASSVASVLASTAPVEVTVVHNGGDLPELPDGVRVIVPGTNTGYAGGANVAIADWLARTTDDLCVVGAHDMHPDSNAVAVVEGVMRGDASIGVGSPMPAEGVSGGKTHEWREGVGDTTWVSGTFMMLRRTAIEQVGPFDEDFHSYVEDVELCTRVTRGGWRVVHVDGVAVRGLGTSSPTARRRMYVNQVRFRLKHEGKRRAWKLALGYPALALYDVYRRLRGIDPAGFSRAADKLRSVPASLGIILKPVRPCGRRRSRRRR